MSYIYLNHRVDFIVNNNLGLKIDNIRDEFGITWSILFTFGAVWRQNTLLNVKNFHWFLGICPQINCFRFNQNDRFTRERTQIGMLRTKHCKSFAFTAWFIVKNHCKQPFCYFWPSYHYMYLWLKVSIINQKGYLIFLWSECVINL